MFSENLRAVELGPRGCQMYPDDPLLPLWAAEASESLCPVPTGLGLRFERSAGPASHAGPGSRCPALRWGEVLTPQGGQSDREPCLEKQSTSGTVTDRAGPVRGGLSGEPEPPRALAVRESGPNTDQGVRLPTPGPPSALVTLDATENDDSVTRKSGTAEDLGAPCRTRQGLRGFAEPHLGEAAGPERARAQWISQRVARVRITHPPSGFGPSLLNAPSPHQSVPQDGGSSSP